MSLSDCLFNVKSSIEKSRIFKAVVPLPSTHWKTTNGITEPIISQNENNSNNIVNLIDCISLNKHTCPKLFILKSIWKYPTSDAAFCIEGFHGIDEIDNVISKIKSSAFDHDGTRLCHRSHKTGGKRGK